MKTKILESSSTLLRSAHSSIYNYIKSFLGFLTKTKFGNFYSPFFLNRKENFVNNKNMIFRRGNTIEFYSSKIYHAIFFATAYQTIEIPTPTPTQRRFFKELNHPNSKAPMEVKNELL